MYLYKSAFKSFVTPLRIIWMTESAYELKTFNSVICEHILNCLFWLCFPESHELSYHRFLSIIIHVMEAMYNEDGNMDRMRRYQEISVSFWNVLIIRWFLTSQRYLFISMILLLWSSLYTLINFITESLQIHKIQCFRKSLCCRVNLEEGECVDSSSSHEG